jgi:hypothetical protein
MAGLSDLIVEQQEREIWARIQAAVSEERERWANRRPVAFRLPEHDGWIILQNEEAAQIEAEHRGVSYQGLYVRDGK